MDIIQSIKKYVVSSGLVVLFVFYVVFQRISDTGTKKSNENQIVIPGISVGAQLKNIITRLSEDDDDDEDRIVTPAPSKTAVATATPLQAVTKNTGLYKDGSYIGTSMDVYYGNVQVQAIVQNGKLVDVIILDQPKDRQYSAELAAYAMPILRTEAIQSQSANVNIVSGATATSGGFKESLATALALAKK